jgi:hypothetical protein
MKSVKKSDFSGLTDYITDEQSKSERVGLVSFTNCEAHNYSGVVAEVLATQYLNKRAESDKTYHLVVSFKPGENPDNDTIQAIEVRICEGLGFGEHQRLSAVHHDTDCLHLHIAINKIHPIRYTIHDPYYDHLILGQLCEKLEKEYGLEPVNHQARKRGAENRADDMENHAGVESLLGWIKRECQEQIQGAQSWVELHQVMNDNGLELRERGNGFVVVAGDGTMVRASSIDRDLSKGKLEGRYGSFESSLERRAESTTKPTREYEARPMRSRSDTVELYARYKVEQQNIGASRAGELAKARDLRNKQVEAIKRSGKLKRSAIKLMVDGRAGKRAMYGMTSSTMKADIQRINKEYLEKRQKISDKYQRQAWADWLRAKATAGDQESLAALRAREVAQGLKGNTVKGSGDRTGPQTQTKQDSITKKGTIIYRVGSTSVREDGDRLKVGRGATEEGLQVALRMAMERYGQKITVNGTNEFKEQIAQAAAAAKLPIIFTDDMLDRRRRELLHSITTKENTNERYERARADERRTDSRRIEGDGLATARDNTAGRTASGRSEAFIPGIGIPGKPNIGRVGRKPPPQSKNRLRGLSELGVVRIAGRSEVLLPGNVPRHLEQQGTQPDNGLRRNVFGAGGVESAPDAVNKYIAEREEKRVKDFDIPKHLRYNYIHDGVADFAGIRQVDGHTLALLKRGEEVMVLPIDDATANRLKRISVGDQVTVTPKGLIRTKGRNR